MSEANQKTYGRLVPIAEAAEWLGISAETLRKKIAHGLVESHKLWGRRLMYEEEIIRLIEESRDRARSETRPRVDSVAATTRGRGRR